MFYAQSTIAVIFQTWKTEVPCAVDMCTLFKVTTLARRKTKNNNAVLENCEKISDTRDYIRTWSHQYTLTGLPCKTTKFPKGKSLFGTIIKFRKYKNRMNCPICTGHITGNKRILQFPTSDNSFHVVRFEFPGKDTVVECWSVIAWKQNGSDNMQALQNYETK